MLSEINARNFFSESRVITIDFAASVAETVMEAVENLPDDLTVIVTASELTRDSKLRKFFEAHKTFPAIACYKEDERTIRNSISQKFRDVGVRVDNDAMNFLAANLGEDKSITTNELEKILLYLGDQKALSYDEVVELMADSSEITLNDISNSVALRDMKKLEKSLSRAFAEHINAVPILRTVAWQFQRMASVRMMAQNGMGIDSALSSLRPPLYAKQLDLFKNEATSNHRSGHDQLKRDLESLKLQKDKISDKYAEMV